MAQFLGSAWKVPVPLPPKSPTPPRGRLCPRRLTGAAGSAPPICLPLRGGCVSCYIWALRIRGHLSGSPLLTLCSLSLPGEVFYTHVLAGASARRFPPSSAGPRPSHTEAVPVACCPAHLPRPHPRLPPSAPSPARSPASSTAPAPFSDLEDEARVALCSAWLSPGGRGTGRSHVSPWGERQLS